MTTISKDFVIFNATPPNIHFAISKLVLQMGYSLIVEKPICLNVYQYRELKKLAFKNKLFIFENMMYFYSHQFIFFEEKIKKKKIKFFEINFSIPNFSRNSFRKSFNSRYLLLYDVVCYPLSLISYLGYKINNYNLTYKYKNKILNFIQISFRSTSIDFLIKISFFNQYQNYVKVTYDDNSSVKLNHFFYGKKVKKKNFLESSDNDTQIKILNEKNIFKKIFNFNKRKFHSLFKKNDLIIENYLKVLLRIKKKLDNSSN